MFVPPHIRIRPITLIAGIVIMLAALLFVAFNRGHDLSPKTPPMHEAR